MLKVEDLIRNIFKKSNDIKTREEYLNRLSSYIKRYGVPTGTKTNDWKEPRAQKLLGKRTLLYKFFNSKLEAVEAAKELYQ